MAWDPPGQGAKRSAEATTEAETSAPEALRPPVSWKGDETGGQVRWKKHKPEDRGPKSETADRSVHTVQAKRVLTAKLRKKMLDKEVPFSQIPSEHMKLYEEAEAKEWADWQKNGSVKTIPPGEAKQVRASTDPRRIINLRFVYRDKNASIRTPQSNLPVKAKARLCAQASMEPTALAGMAKLDSPTVQR